MMNFIEFNVPKIMIDHIPSWTSGKSVLEHTFKKGILRIVGTFNRERLQKRVERDYQKVYDDINKKQLAINKKIKKAFNKIKDKYALKSKETNE